MERRTAVILTVIGAATLGSGYALRRESRSDWHSGVAQLFAASFDDANGQQQPMAQWQGRLLVVNFWATWCSPCLEEMPMLDRLRATYRTRGVEVVGIGIDAADKIIAYQAKHQFKFPLVIAGTVGSGVSRSLGNEQGVLPYTVLIGPKGVVARRWTGLVAEQDLRSALDDNLSKAS
jgi:thiol-disulfide isomerase/thioredoxin